MRDRRFDDPTGDGTATGLNPVGIPGKHTRAERLSGSPRVHEGGAQVAPAGAGPSPGAPVVGGDGAVTNTPTTKTTVSFTESAAPPLTFSAKDYRELYGQVSARVGKEAGSVKMTPTRDIQTDASGNVVTATFTYALATMLPEWPQKGTQPAEDQAKFTAWRQSVVDHEKQHRDLYRRELAKVKAQVIGPKESDVNTQQDAVEAAAEVAQDAFDASNQPAPLAVPGGIEKVPSPGTQADGNGLPAGDGGTAAV